VFLEEALRILYGRETFYTKIMFLPLRRKLRAVYLLKVIRGRNRSFAGATGRLLELEVDDQVVGVVWLQIQEQIVVLLDLAPMLSVLARHLAWVHFA